MEIGTLQQDAARLRDNANSLAQAAHYMKLAAAELRPVVVPVASGAITKSVRTTGAIASTAFKKCPKVSAAFGKLADVNETQVKRAIVVGAAVSALAAFGFTVATIKHISNRRKKRNAEKAAAAEEQ